MNTRIQDNNTNHGGSFLMGLITGSAIGAGLAIYFAPRLASELRQRVTDSTTGVRNAASEGLQDVATRVADVVDRVADVADDVTRRGQAARDDVAGAGGRGAHGRGRGGLGGEPLLRPLEVFFRSVFFLVWEGTPGARGASPPPPWGPPLPWGKKKG